MTYAIIQLAGKQYRVAEGETITVDRQEHDQKTFTVSDVLLTHTDTETKVGTPLVAGASVSFSVEKDQRGEKIRVFKFKAKSRYRRTQGHRQEQTVLKVEKISA